MSHLNSSHVPPPLALFFLNDELHRQLSSTTINGTSIPSPPRRLSVSLKKPSRHTTNLPSSISIVVITLMPGIRLKTTFLSLPPRRNNARRVVRVEPTMMMMSLRLVALLQPHLPRMKRRAIPTCTTLHRLIPPSSMFYGENSHVKFSWRIGKRHRWH